MELDKFIVYGTAGALLLSSLYHGMLYRNRKEPILLDYSKYLCVCFATALIAILIINKAGISESAGYILMNIAAFSSYALYFKFASTAYGVRKENNKFNWLLVQIVYVLIALYLVVMLVSELFITRYNFVERILFNTASTFMSAVGFYASVYYFKTNKSLFIRQMLMGSACLSIFNVYYVIYTNMHPQADFLSSFSILCQSCFSEIIFYSIALATKMNRDLQEKISATQKLNEFQQVLLNAELEKQELIYAGTQNERKRISREMHDELSNSLVGLKYYISDIKNRQQNEAQEIVFKNIEDEVSEVYLQAREYMYKLHNTTQEHQYDLVSFLESTRLRFAESTLSIKINADYNSIEHTLNSLQKNTVYFVIKEVLTNIMKYAEASEVQIALYINGALFFVIITDNGVGIDIKGKQGIGIKSIEERAAFLNGIFVIDKITKGTKAVFSFPVTGSG